VIELKEARLVDERPSCRLDHIKLDLTDRSSRKALLPKASAHAAKILVLTEGVVPYLADGDVAELADDLRQVEKVRYWIIDYFSPEAIRFGQKMRARFMRNAPFRFAPKDWFGFFDRRGWKPTEIRYIADEAERLGRPIPLPLLLKVWVKLAGIFMSRERKERMKRFAAYVLLVPK
jgi:O-methyltransferase involved in polyketide biosynthesis